VDQVRADKAAGRRAQRRPEARHRHSMRVREGESPLQCLFLHNFLRSAGRLTRPSPENDANSRLTHANGI
jgi:hypothetical protein